MTATVAATSNINLGNFVSGANRERAAEFYEKKKIVALCEAVAGAAKFHTNKIMHMATTHDVTATRPFLSNIEDLKYFVGRDEQGVLRGGNLHWEYLFNLCDSRDTDAVKFKKLCRELACLPSNVAFEFKAAPDMRDGDIVRAAFLRAGFSNIYNKTYLYFGNVEDGDPIKKIKSDSRTKVNSARRDMELTTMSLNEFFAFYNRNLIADKKEAHFFLQIDEEVIAKSTKVEILAARRKGLMEDGNPYPIESAMCCGYGDDGYYKLMRITYASEGTGVIPHAPHKHALKFLVVEAMRRSAELGMILDVDGATVGGGTLYTRFGVFEEVMRDQYKRKTAQTFICKFCNPLKLERIAKEMRLCLGRLAAFTVLALFCA